MRHGKDFYFGNANADQVRNSGWFVGQFVPPELGLRHQTDVELKWGVHTDGDKRPPFVGEPQPSRSPCCSRASCASRSIPRGRRRR
jgi:hypothetical protein